MAAVAAEYSEAAGIPSLLDMHAWCRVETWACRMPWMTLTDGRNIRRVQRWTIPHGVVATQPDKIQSLLVVSALIAGEIHANDDVTD